MQQKNQASMSEEEQEGEVIDRRNTEEVSPPPIPLSFCSAPIQPRDVISCRVIPCLCLAGQVENRVTEEEGARRNVPASFSCYLSSPPSPLYMYRSGSEPTHRAPTPHPRQEVMSHQFRQH